MSLLWLTFISCKKSNEPNNPPTIDTALSTHDFAPIGAKWYYFQEFAWSENIVLDSIESVGDTIIKGQHCRILVNKGDSYCEYYKEKYFVYRKEGVVYFYSSDTDSFQILYNFHAQKDSTWINIINSYGSFFDTILVKVETVKSIYINGIKLKKFYVTYNYLNANYLNYGGIKYNGVIIEKIGDLTFLINLSKWGEICEIADQGLRCYKDPQLNYYETSPDSCNCDD